MSRDAGGRSSRRAMSLGIIGVGAVLLLLVPIYVLVNALSGNTTAGIEGTWLIVSVVTGMALVAVGAALRD